ncbi:hypothetical protein A9Q81_26675 [Gammaproteobacteria bacterium 42_54_T18]|mgnify:CR=1 FL=1|nr:hypothetical protein A9Q81_26675 [Gammaproteobacteria bacterium 42_54_T18]
MSETITILGYTVHHMIGKGGMASVYLATQKSLNRQVAIKVLADFGDPNAEERFFMEARTVAALNHPHIITVYDVAHLEDGRPYLSMEYLSGGDLDSLKGKSVGMRYALELIRQVTQGLDSVHKKGIIHRDIKPANILFREDNSVVLSDFGIAKDLSVNTELTQAGISVGSPSYSSPEQIYGQQLDQRSDIYSLGVILLELLLGCNPYKGENYAETVVNHTERSIPDLAMLQRPCQALLGKMLKKQPEQRHQTTEELISDIDALLDMAPDNDDQTKLRSTPLRHKATSDHLQWIEKHQKSGLILLGLLIAILVLFKATYKSETDRKIDALLEQAETHLADNQFIAPEFDNARYFYNQILTLETDNDDALDGLEVINEQLVERYIKLAAERFEETQLNRPKGNNAIYYYRQALAIESDNEAALTGLQRVVTEYIALANKSFNRKDYGTGLRHVRIGLELAPKNQELLGLKEQYKVCAKYSTYYQHNHIAS